ncbi:ATPase, partial [Clostridium saudiense]|nr:ATPase [Clostridium saudiense]
MNKLELNIIDLLEYLQEMLDSSAKMPITGKVMV